MMTDRANNIGETLKLYRRDKKLSLRDLADLTGISAATLSRIERGLTIPTLSQLHDIATAYGYDDVRIAFTGSNDGQVVDLDMRLATICLWAKAQLDIARELVDALEAIVASTHLLEEGDDE